jgi:hypothetical protein
VSPRAPAQEEFKQLEEAESLAEQAIDAAEKDGDVEEAELQQEVRARAALAPRARPVCVRHARTARAAAARAPRLARAARAVRRACATQRGAPSACCAPPSISQRQRQPPKTPPEPFV